MKITEGPDEIKVLGCGTVGCLILILSIVVAFAIIAAIGVRVFNWIA